jgi:hypothetical protein
VLSYGRIIEQGSKTGYVNQKSEVKDVYVYVYIHVYRCVRVCVFKYTYITGRELSLPSSEVKANNRAKQISRQRERGRDVALDACVILIFGRKKIVESGQKIKKRLHSEI